MDWEYIYLPIFIILIIFLPGFFIVSAIFPRKNQLDGKDDTLIRIMLSFLLGIFYIVFTIGILHIFPSPGFDKWPINPTVTFIVEIFGIVCFAIVALFRKSYIFEGYEFNNELVKKFKTWRNTRYRRQLLHEKEGREEKMSEKEKLELERIDKDIENIEKELGETASEIYDKRK